MKILQTMSTSMVMSVYESQSAKSLLFLCTEDELGCSSDGDPVSRSAITKHPGGCTYHDCAGLLNDLINRTC